MWLYGNKKSNTAHTRIVYKVLCSKTKQNKIGIGRPSSEKIRASSDILSDELRGSQSLQPSFRALSSRAIFMFQVNSVEKVCFRLVM